MSTYTPRNRLVGEKYSIDIIGLYIGAIRERFDNVAEGFPWRWDKDPNKSRIVIEAGSVDTYDQTDSRPSIYVDRSGMVFSQVVLGNMADFDMQTAETKQYCMANSQISVDCISSNRGECSNLADITAHHLLMSEDVFRSALGFRDMSPITMGNTQPWEKDERVFVTRVTSEFSYELSWSNKPIADRLERMFLYLQ